MEQKEDERLKFDNRPNRPRFSKLTLILQYIRYGVGSAMLFGVTPQFLGLWAVWRGATVFLPNWMYRWGDDKLYSLYQRLVLFFFETCTGVEVILYGDTEQLLQRQESVLYIANHQSTVDWLVADMVAVRGGNLGHLRYVMKDQLQLLPLYGHYFYAHGCIYVRRGSFNQSKMLRALHALLHPKIRTWLVIFPEGTRYYPSTPDVIEKSEKYAHDNNRPVLRHHLTPKHRGTWLAMEHLHQKFDAVYDVSVFYEGTVHEGTEAGGGGRWSLRGNAPQLIEFLMGRCPRVHIKVRRIPISEVPKTEEKLKTWLHDLFVSKDDLLTPFITGLADPRNELGGNTLQPAHATSDTIPNASNGAQVSDVNNCNGGSGGASSGSSISSGSTYLISSGKINYTDLSMFYNGKRSRLGVWETLPSFLLFGGITVSCFLFPLARKAYFGFLLYGTLGSYVLLAIRNVC